MAKGVPSKMAIGNDQLSYCAAKIKNTKIKDRVRMVPNDPDAFFSWKDIAFHAYPISEGNTSSATSSKAAIACAEV